MKLTSARSNNTCENTIFSEAEISTTEPPSVDKHFLPNPSNDHFSLDKEDPPEGPVLTHINTTWCGPYIIRVLQCRRRVKKKRKGHSASKRILLTRFSGP
ncbi:hypothetical protein K0M31_017126 [Melipona bicolor]|uniref:Uncharacterized protein n=1 Tax=Melipona bicolor TaxID=60889 RepID=A0AA40FDT2_9HYME|nr:hypothetical protein K0M31_017126 [Melipona bicolor]